MNDYSPGSRNFQYGMYKMQNNGRWRQSCINYTFVCHLKTMNSSLYLNSQSDISEALSSCEHHAADLIFPAEDICGPMPDQPGLGHSGEGGHHPILLPWPLHTNPGQQEALMADNQETFVTGCWWPLVFYGSEHHMQSSGCHKYKILFVWPIPSGWRACECDIAQRIRLKPSN